MDLNGQIRALQHKVSSFEEKQDFSIDDNDLEDLLSDIEEEPKAEVKPKKLKKTVGFKFKGLDQSKPKGVKLAPKPLKPQLRNINFNQEVDMEVDPPKEEYKDVSEDSDDDILNEILNSPSKKRNRKEDFSIEIWEDDIDASSQTDSMTSVEKKLRYKFGKHKQENKNPNVGKTKMRRKPQQKKNSFNADSESMIEGICNQLNLKMPKR